VQETCLRAAAEGLLRSAHDCSDGGISVAIAESCFSSLNRAGIGADIALNSNARLNSSTRDRAATALFSESPSRIVVSLAESAITRVSEIASELNCPFALLGRVGGNRLNIKIDEREEIDAGVEELESIWRTSLSRRLGAEVLAATAE
jgi:phosphoribosylformylglycinamidine synthase